MKLIGKKNGEILELKLIQVHDKYLSEREVEYLNGKKITLKSLTKNFTDVKEPLIKNTEVRKVVKEWAVANGFSIFTIHNQNFNCVKIHGMKGWYDKGLNIEFMGTTIAGVEKRTYKIDELCGEN